MIDEIARARLSDAAHDLLEACELAVSILERNGVCPLRDAFSQDEEDKIKAAIIKAT